MEDIPNKTLRQVYEHLNATGNANVKLTCGSSIMRDGRQLYIVVLSQAFREIPDGRLVKDVRQGWYKQATDVSLTTLQTLVKNLNLVFKEMDRAHVGLEVVEYVP